MLAENFLLGSMSYRVYLLNSLFGVFFVYFIIIFNASNKLINLVHTTQVNSTFCWRGLASLEVISYSHLSSRGKTKWLLSVYCQK